MRKKEGLQGGFPHEGTRQYQVPVASQSQFPGEFPGLILGT